MSFYISTTIDIASSRASICSFCSRVSTGLRFDAYICTISCASLRDKLVCTKQYRVKTSNALANSLVMKAKTPLVIVDWSSLQQRHATRLKIGILVTYILHWFIEKSEMFRSYYFAQLSVLSTFANVSVSILPVYMGREPLQILSGVNRTRFLLLTIFNIYVFLSNFYVFLRQN